MAFHTGPLYHLKGRSKNVENHNKLLDSPRGLGRDLPLNDPEHSVRVRPEMFRETHFFSGPGLALESNEKISVQTSA